jgi:PAS domain S-box-containing protein
MTTDLLGVADLEGRFLELSPSWERLLGYAREELLAAPYLSFVHPEDRERTVAEATRLAEQGGEGSPTFVNRYRCKDDSYRWLEWSSTADRDAGVVYFVARDVSDRVRLEREVRLSLEQVRTYSAELEAKNGALEREVVERREAERALALKEEAICELGTPILRVWEGVLLLPVIGAVDRDRAGQMMARLLPAIVDTGAAVTILDLTGVGAVDAATASHLFEIVRAVGLLGSRCVVSGISPAIARTMIELGVVDQRLTTFGTLASALGYALQGRAARVTPGRPGGSTPR